MTANRAGGVTAIRCGRVTAYRAGGVTAASPSGGVVADDLAAWPGIAGGVARWGP